MNGEPSDEGREQEGYEHQSTTHQKPEPSGTVVKDGLHYTTESMPVGLVEFVEGSGDW